VASLSRHSTLTVASVAAKCCFPTTTAWSENYNSSAFTFGMLPQLRHDHTFEFRSAFGSFLASGERFLFARCINAMSMCLFPKRSPGALGTPGLPRIRVRWRGCSARAEDSNRSQTFRSKGEAPDWAVAGLRRTIIGGEECACNHAVAPERCSRCSLNPTRQKCRREAAPKSAQTICNRSSRAWLFSPCSLRKMSPYFCTWALVCGP
jgi:hypothetical protein